MNGIARAAAQLRRSGPHTLGHLFYSGAGFLLLPLFALHLNQQEYAEIALVFSLVQLTAPVFILGVDQAIERDILKRGERVAAIFKIQALVGTVAFLLSSICVLAYDFLLPSNTFVGPLVVLLITWQALNATFLRSQTALGDTAKIGFVQIIIGLLILLIGVAAHYEWLELNWAGMRWMWLLVPSAATAFAFFYQLQSDLRNNLGHNEISDHADEGVEAPPTYVELSSLGFSLLPFVLVNSVLSSGNVLVATFWGADYVAVFDVSARLSGIILVLSFGFRLLTPFYMRSESTNVEQMFATWLYGFLALTILSTPALQILADSFFKMYPELQETLPFSNLVVLFLVLNGFGFSLIKSTKFEPQYTWLLAVVVGTIVVVACWIFYFNEFTFYGAYGSILLGCLASFLYFTKVTLVICERFSFITHMAVVIISSLPLFALFELSLPS